MNASDVLGAAALLSLERVCYLWIWRAPESFRTLYTYATGTHTDTPVAAVAKLFYAFKGVQAAVFLGWCYVYGQGMLWPLAAPVWALGLGGVLLVVGQILNLSVFYRLGKVGVFYGNRFGYHLPWCQAFPFSLLDHPQYVGTLLSIWGFFLIMRFPYDDWSVLPLIETVYYVLGAYYERDV